MDNNEEFVWTDIDLLFQDNNVPQEQIAEKDQVSSGDPSTPTPPPPRPNVPAVNLISFSETHGDDLKQDISKFSRKLNALMKYLGPNPPRFSWYRRQMIRAWDSKYPNSRTIHGYHVFVKEKLSDLKAAHPQLTHGDHMKLLGKMWKETNPSRKRARV
jgi:HMG (high mobility group) box